MSPVTRLVSMFCSAFLVAAIAVPDAPRLVGFAYEMEARDGEGRKTQIAR